jgi:hypothetical protein
MMAKMQHFAYTISMFVTSCRHHAINHANMLSMIMIMYMNVVTIVIIMYMHVNVYMHVHVSVHIHHVYAGVHGLYIPWHQSRQCGHHDHHTLVRYFQNIQRNCAIPMT